MSAQCEVTAKAAAHAPMSLFERWLTLWVFLCIVAGILLGQLLPAPFQALGRMEVARVNLPGRPAHLGDDRADAGEGGLRRPARSAPPRARHRRDAVRELAGEALLDGLPRLAVHPPAVRALLPAGRSIPTSPA
jgi:hypothetical protein